MAGAVVVLSNFNSNSLTWLPPVMCGDITWVAEQEGISDLGHHVPHFEAQIGNDDLLAPLVRRAGRGFNRLGILFSTADQLGPSQPLVHTNILWVFNSGAVDDTFCGAFEWIECYDPRMILGACSLAQPRF
jgi:hypothetical protein